MIENGKRLGENLSNIQKISAYRITKKPAIHKILQVA